MISHLYGMKLMFTLLLMAFSCQIRMPAQEGQPVTASDLKAWCCFLAGDEMKGRKNGTAEMKRAADYISDCFKEAKLRPFSGEKSYFQEYNFKGRQNIEISERNVIGILDGSDSVLKNEWIILSAHFDHIGIGKPVNGDSIFNGADDNASGTVTLMALAKALGSSVVRPRRSILFAAFSGEEMGMRGSRWFVEHTPIPLDQIKLDLNFEMEGESESLGKNMYILTGHQFTDFADLLDSYNANTKWKRADKFKTPPWVFTASDNATFAIKRVGEEVSLNIPAFTLVTTDNLAIIHKVTDEPQRLDYDNMASFVAYAAGLVLYLSANPLDIHWDREAFSKFIGQ
jgi:hypothetical protein